MQFTTNEEIQAYNNKLEGNYVEIANFLSNHISLRLKVAESKVWHRTAVWFMAGNPIVGYAKQKKGICLLFWSGQSFDEPKLIAEGKFKAAQIFYNDVEEIKTSDLNKWLKKAETIQWDYKNIVKRKGVLLRLE